MKINISGIQKARLNDEILTWITCYDYSFARALNETGIDLILVGDSGGMVSLGYADTSPVTMDEMILMCSAVRRGASDKFIVGDMPRGSYESSNESAVRNAMRFVKEAGADAIKLEGGMRIKERVKAISNSGISVIGHIGLTPQSSNLFGGYRVTGREKSEREKLEEDAQSLIEAGAFAILLEAMPSELATRITCNSTVPIFGIGAGPGVNGQLLILHDLLGLYPNFRPKFAKNYVPSILADFNNFLAEQENIVAFGRETRRDGLFEISKQAVDLFVRECKNRRFPSEDFEYA